MNEHVLRFLRVVVFPWLAVPLMQAGAQTAAVEVPENSLAADEIVSRMMQSNDRRARDLASYSGSRKYRLDYKGFPGSRSAEMEVQMTFTAPGQKEFTVVKESGSKVVINRVFKKLLESEREAQSEASRRETALTPENYQFELTGLGDLDGRKAYVLAVKPHKPSKFLYEGRIWVDAEDFAVMKIDARPAKNPSFWISRVAIAHSYGKVDRFWLPAHNTSVSKVRLGGTATLTIDYLDYKVVASPGRASGTH